MNILILGSGGREHALAWKIKQSPKTGNIFIAPGNAGTAGMGENLPVNPNDFEAVKSECLRHNIDMVIVGPEEPLANGIYDFFRNDAELCRIPLIGPSQAGAQLESSKDFAKRFMQRHGIPTARYETFTKETVENAFSFLRSMQPPYVLKADGLAAGKGVLIIQDFDEACRELREIFDGRFGKAGNKVVIEQFLDGIECSVFALTDGAAYCILPTAKDYKRIGEGDTGMNTGGMGSISPVPFADKEFMNKVEDRIIRPTVEGLAKDGIVYKGFIFFGLINVNNEPLVIEYNCRMGDPETQSVMPRICNDLVTLFESVITGSLRTHSIIEDPRTVASVVLTSGGYPGDYEKGFPINISEPADATTDETLIFHAATMAGSGQICTNGGRVMAVSAYGCGRKDALLNAYRAVNRISFNKMYYRKDIGFDL
ncbi:MAG: phosphoribosylamine--glycine ligase [Tannerellaceae bacterium]|nr:phosphoribosylamine--glycine ligase [Tannerellaceae bacterium]